LHELSKNIKKCPKRFTWRIIEAWRRGGNGRKRSMMATSPPPQQKHTNELHCKTNKQKTMSCSKNLLHKSKNNNLM